ncbi:MAG: GNAT family N-acetyltransferase [Bacteroidia bacterium]
MDLKFKKASKDDVSLIAQLADRIWKKHYASIITMEQINYMLDKGYSAESLSKQMDQGHEFTLVYDGTKPLGYISFDTSDGKNYFLHKFYIEVDDQGKGIGSELFTHVLKQMPNAETIELFVNRENYKSINFYFKHGFVIKNIINQDIGNGFYMNDFIMIKKIK